eukprot:2041304-Ditylum_brightwellii.AAC.1
MHKPTVTIGNEDEEIMQAQKECNLNYALASSLLLMERNDCSIGGTGVGKGGSVVCDLNVLFEEIANLSYAGDPRMDIGGEDPAKVHKLVHSPGQSERFWNLYRYGLEELHSKGLIHVTNGTTSQKTLEYNPCDMSTRSALFSMLPPRLKQFPSSSNGSGELSQLQLARAITDIVKPAARDQSIKGALTAGIVRSVRYAGAKFAKGALRKFPLL